MKDYEIKAIKKVLTENPTSQVISKMYELYGKEIIDSIMGWDIKPNIKIAENQHTRFIN